MLSIIVLILLKLTFIGVVFMAGMEIGVKKTNTAWRKKYPDFLREEDTKQNE